MKKVSNCHEGHRERMLKKFISSHDTMPDHEILEILLFYAIPRKDTNEIAHNLIRAFGSLSNVFTKTPQELMVVDGVGERTAMYLCLFGEVCRRNDFIEKNKTKTKFIRRGL